MIRKVLVPLVLSVSVLGACGEREPGKSDGGVVSTTTALRFASCDAARAAGYSSMKRGEAGYSSQLDGDGDGVACDAPAKMTFAECQESAEYPGGKYAVEFDNGVCTVQRP